MKSGEVPGSMVIENGPEELPENRVMSDKSCIVGLSRKNFSFSSV